MKRTLLAATVLFGLSGLAAPTPSDAQLATVCVNCSTIVQELAEYARQGQQYLTEVAQLQSELQQYANMVQNTVALPMMVMTTVTSDINQVRNLANAASVLTGNSAGILQRLQMAGGYASQVGSMPAQFSAQLTMWQQTLGNANHALGNVLATQQAQQLTYAAQQQQISTQAQTAAGQMQAIQAGVAMSGVVSTQLNQIQATLTAAAQETATRDLVNADRSATEDANWQAFLNGPQASATGYQTWQFK
jgi:type IV secretion system protein TrbJ